MENTAENSPLELAERVQMRDGEQGETIDAPP